VKLGKHNILAGLARYVAPVRVRQGLGGGGGLEMRRRSYRIVVMLF
jgi:hypothetical protein